MAFARTNKASKRRSPAALPSVLWEDVLANLSDAIIFVAADDSVISCNPASEQLLGLPQAQIRGRRYQDLFERSPAIAALIQRAHESGQTQSQTMEALVRADRALPVRIVTAPVLDGAGRLRGTVVVIHDLRYQRALQEDVERAERLTQLGAVAAGLAHEIKNPLGGIKGAAQLLQRDFANEPAIREYTEVMIREADRLSGLVEQLLNLGSLKPPHFSSLNIHRLIDEVLLLTREAPGAGGIRVRCEFDPSLPPVRGDERQLKQVLLNLVTNACQAMNGRGKLTLRTRIETSFHIVSARHGSAKFIRVEVEDDGPGIPAEHLSQIFDPFFTTKSRGTGLGLAISQRIVSEHGGSLRASAPPGGGTVMTLSLPVAAE